MQTINNILSDNGFNTLEQFINIERCLIALDFDGTLAPIVDLPNDASMTSEVTQELENLIKIRNVLILTGRSIDDTKKRVPHSVPFILGNHGLEGCSHVSAEALKEAYELTRKWINILKNEFVPNKHIIIEDKKYSLSIHFHNAFIEKFTCNQIHTAVKKLLPTATLIDGKRVVNVLPPNFPNKYTALIAFMKDNDFTRAIFVGDDITDNDVFCANDQRILSIKIGKRKELVAHWYLERQEEIENLLKTMTFLCKNNHS